MVKLIKTAKQLEEALKNGYPLRIALNLPPDASEEDEYAALKRSAELLGYPDATPLVRRGK